MVWNILAATAVSAIWIFLMFSRFMYDSDPTSSNSKLRDRVVVLFVSVAVLTICTSIMFVGEGDNTRLAIDLVFAAIIFFFLLTIFMSYIQLYRYQSDESMWQKGGLYSIPLMIRSLLRGDSALCQRISNMYEANPRQFIVGCFVPIFNTWFAAFVFFCKDKYVVVGNGVFQASDPDGGNATSVEISHGILLLPFDEHPTNNRGIFHFAFWDVKPANQIAQTVAAIFALGFYSAYYAFYRRLLYGLKVEAVQVQRHKALLRTRVNDIELLAQAWIIDEDEIELKRAIAQGAQGMVHYGSLRGKYEVAIKILLNSSHVNLESDEEIRFLQRARHPRLVMFLGAGRGHVEETDQEVIFIVMEYCDMGTLQSFLYRSPGEDEEPDVPTWDLRLSLLNDVSEGMSFLHEIHKSVHRDLKTSNVLLSEEDSRGIRAKVADFGLSRFIDRVLLVIFCIFTVHFCHNKIE
eukprot:g5036.t1